MADSEFNESAGHLDILGPPQNAEPSQDHETAAQQEEDTPVNRQQALEDAHRLNMEDVPERPGDYKLKRPVSAHGEEFNLEIEQAARQLMHSAGLNQTAANVVYEAAFERDTPPTEQEAKLDAAKTISQLRGMWGEQTNAKVEAAREVINSLPPAQQEAAKALLEATGAGNNPKVISQLAQIGMYRRKQNQK